MVSEEKLTRIIRRKFSYGIPHWAMENILKEIIEECKKIDSYTT